MNKIESGKLRWFGHVGIIADERRKGCQGYEKILKHESGLKKKFAKVIKFLSRVKSTEVNTIKQNVIDDL